MAHTIVLDDVTHAKQTLSRLMKWLQVRITSGQRIKLTVEEERRNNAQNALLHATLQEIAQTQEWAGKKRDIDTWKRLFTAGWMRARGEQIEILPAIDGNGIDIVWRPTHKLTKQEMAELIDYIQAWQSEKTS